MIVYKPLAHKPPLARSVEVTGGGWYHIPWTKETKADYIERNLVITYEDDPLEVQS